MSARTMQSPGVELNEIDRSNYQKVDNSLPNSPIVFTVGYADQGQDTTVEWIDSKNTLDKTFGTPTTEFESYFYNSIMEVLNRGGSCIASKLPYDNNQFEKYNYVDFNISQLCAISKTNPFNIDDELKTIKDLQDALSNILSVAGNEYASLPLDTVGMIADATLSAYEYFKKSNDEANIEDVKDISSYLYRILTDSSILNDDFSLVYLNDMSLTSYLKISVCPNLTLTSGYGDKGTMEDLDNLLVSNANRGILKNKIRIYDITRAKYDSIMNYECVSSDALSSWTNECLGIVPVIVSPTNALFFQNLLQVNESMRKIANSNVLNNVSAYNGISSFATIAHAGIHQDFSGNQMMSIPLASNSSYNQFDSLNVDSLSRRAAKTFPAINFFNSFHYDKTNLKKIGVAVFKAFKDSGNNGKISFQLLESFVGSLKKNDRDEITKAGIFIDDVVNENSQFIRLFSNADEANVTNASTFVTSLQPAVSLGFYREDCTKKISYANSIVKPLNIILDKISNPNSIPIDIIVDGGISNIAQLAHNQNNNILDTSAYPNVADYNWKLNYANNNISAWKAVLQMFDNFCKSRRKDCMLLADGLRPICLDGNQKIVRPTKPENTVSGTIIPKFKYIARQLNSSYAAGYCNWYLQQDYSNSEKYFWIPPSIKAAGVCIYCDTYFHPWSAPAGNVRGIINDVVDVAFVPGEDDAGVIYSNEWNYAMSYPITGIVIEGHKTFQQQKTALDRINVRRLMLYLEKRVLQVARTFVYEQNTPYMRQQFVDNIKPILEDAVSGDGIRDYAIKCDDELNTTQVIENNEMRCKIAVRPVKVVDWIVVDFICTNQSANVAEEVLR